MSTNAFTPTGNTFVFTANVAAPTAVQVTPNAPGNQYRVVNGGNVAVFMGYGANATIAQNNSVIPGANSSPALILLPGTVEVFSLPPSAFFSGITASGTANVYIVTGDGL